MCLLRIIGTSKGHGIWAPEPARLLSLVSGVNNASESGLGFLTKTHRFKLRI